MYIQQFNSKKLRTAKNQVNLISINIIVISIPSMRNDDIYVKLTILPPTKKRRHLQENFTSFSLKHYYTMIHTEMNTVAFKFFLHSSMHKLKIAPHRARLPKNCK